MKKSLCLISATLILLTGCAMPTSVQNKLASMQLQKKQLANGNTVYVDYNLTPTADWKCQAVGTPQSYNWAMIKTQGQFQLSGPRGLLLNKALAYANQEELKTNYINLQIPEEDTFTRGYNGGKITNSYDLHPNAQAVASYYRCKLINPQHKLGVEKQKDFSITTG